jgi:hypothetical protein
VRQEWDIICYQDNETRILPDYQGKTEYHRISRWCERMTHYLLSRQWNQILPIIKAVWKEWIKCYRLSRQHEEMGHYPFIKITRLNVTQLSCEG